MSEPVSLGAAMRWESEASTAMVADVDQARALERFLLEVEKRAFRIARIAVRFTADIATVTRDKDGNVIAGSLDDAIESRDVWTFARDVTSAAPDWVLDETDEG